MKKHASLIMAIMMMAVYLVFPAMAMDTTDSAEELMEMNGVYIPATATRTQEGSATVYYDFYDSINERHYSFYNTETGEYFAMSPLKTRAVTRGGKSTYINAHDYYFRTNTSTDGSINGIYFELPSDTVYLEGLAEVHKFATGEIVTDEYENGVTYSIQVRENTLLLPQRVTFTGRAGYYITGEFEADGGTYYLFITAGKINDWDYIEGSGELYYYG